MLGWDGQLFDDARLVVAVARTAAGYGASVLTRTRAQRVTGDGAVLRDELSGDELVVRARAVVSAVGVWAGGIDPDVHLMPSRGTHLIVETARLGGSDVSLTAPVPGSSSRFVFTVPAPHGRAYIGLTDVPAPGPIPDVPAATDAEIDMLLATINGVLARPLTRTDVIGTFAGLRPLLTDGPGASRPAICRVGTRWSSRRTACCRWSAASSRPIAGWRRTGWMPRCAAGSHRIPTTGRAARRGCRWWGRGRALGSAS
ncbi:FAD-dependent oxidoreductase [Microbacterium elymi]|uniref:FAD-dependent oxidoreductase n=1 Tax=Microbacterium elymi TaxID=2909587 RepID=UPI00338E406B